MKVAFRPERKSGRFWATAKAQHPQLHDMTLLSCEPAFAHGNFQTARAGCGRQCLRHSYHSEGRGRYSVRVPERYDPDAPGAYTRKPGTHLPTASQRRRRLEKHPSVSDTVESSIWLRKTATQSVLAVTLHTMRHTFASWLAQSGKGDAHGTCKSSCVAEHHHDHAVCSSVLWSEASSRLSGICWPESPS